MFLLLLYCPSNQNFYALSLSTRVINAGKSALNEDQACCEVLVIKRKPGGNPTSSQIPMTRRRSSLPNGEGFDLLGSLVSERTFINLMWQHLFEMILEDFPSMFPQYCWERSCVRCSFWTQWAFRAANSHCYSHWYSIDKCRKAAQRDTDLILFLLGSTGCHVSKKTRNYLLFAGPSARLGTTASLFAYQMKTLWIKKISDD